MISRLALKSVKGSHYTLFDSINRLTVLMAKLDCAEKSVVRFKFAFGVSAYALGRIAEVSVLETEHKIFRIRKNFFFVLAVFRRKIF